MYLILEITIALTYLATLTWHEYGTEMNGVILKKKKEEKHEGYESSFKKFVQIRGFKAHLAN